MDHFPLQTCCNMSDAILQKTIVIVHVCEVIRRRLLGVSLVLMRFRSRSENKSIVQVVGSQLVTSGTWRWHFESGDDGFVKGHLPLDLSRWRWVFTFVFVNPNGYNFHLVPCLNQQWETLLPAFLR